MPLFAPRSFVTIGATDSFAGFELRKLGSVTNDEAAWVEMAEQAFREASVAAPRAFGAQVKAALLAEGKSPDDASAEATALLNSLDNLSTEQQWDLLLKYGDAFQQILSLQQGEKLHVTIAKYFIARRISQAWCDSNTEELQALGVGYKVAPAAPNKEVDMAWVTALAPFLPVETMMDVYEFYCLERDAWALRKYADKSPDGSADGTNQEPVKGPVKEPAKPQTLGEESPQSTSGSPPTGRRSTTK